jgi:hypothetical protein
VWLVCGKESITKLDKDMWSASWAEDAIEEEELYATGCSTTSVTRTRCGVLAVHSFARTSAPCLAAAASRRSVNLVVGRCYCGRFGKRSEGGSDSNGSAREVSASEGSESEGRKSEGSNMEDESSADWRTGSMMQATCGAVPRPSATALH